MKMDKEASQDLFLLLVFVIFVSAIAAISWALDKRINDVNARLDAIEKAAK